MALNDTFIIQEMDLNTKDFAFDIKPNKLDLYWDDECEKHPSNNHCKIFCD